MAEKFQRSPEGRGDLSAYNSIIPDHGGARNGMSEDELAVAIVNQERQSQSFAYSQLSGERARALEYYLGRPFGNEVEGRSQVVSTDVFEAVEGMLPSLLEIFLSSNRLAECEPNGPEDEKEARQQSDVANHVILKQNNAALIFYTWFKDALVQKTGVVKTYYETEDEIRLSRWQGLTDEEMTSILSDPNVEPVERVQRQVQLPTPQGMVEINVNDVTAKVHVKRDHIRIKNVAPENFFISVRHESLDLNSCEFCSHKERKTVTDLLEMGVEQEFLETCGTDDSEHEFSQERISRDLYRDSLGRDPANEDPSMRELWVSDVYLQIDFDGDGVAELRHVLKIGNRVWLNEETDMVPFSVICPIIMPHQFYGLSVADITSDVQLVKSTLWRQMLDNLYLTNNPRLAVVEGQVNLDDLLSWRPGGVLRQRAPNMITPLAMPFVAKESFPMLEYWDSVKENRTGVTRYNQGTDADSLNKTARGINAILGQSLKRLELIARMFAETGVKDLVRKVLHCVSKSGMKRMVLKLTNSYTAIDPREWQNQFNITINVGLGTGNKDHLIQMLSMLSGKQLELKQTGRQYMVSESNDYNMAVKLSESAGFKNPELFFTDPSAVPPQAKQPPPNPDIVKLETDTKLRVADMQATTQAKDKDMANDRHIAEMEAAIKSKTDIAVAEIAKQAQIMVAQIRSDTERRLALADAAVKDNEMRGKADIEVFKTNASEANRKTMETAESIEQVVQTMITPFAQSQAQTAEILGQVAQVLQQMQAFQMAPRKRVRDEQGRMVGVEVDGFGQVPVQ